MALTIQEYRGVTEMADSKINELGNYLTKHPSNGKVYTSYASRLAETVLVLRGAGVDIVLPHKLSGWVEQFESRISMLKGLAELYAGEEDLEEYVKFLLFVLDNIRPTCSRILNTMQLSEVDFVIEKLKKVVKKIGVADDDVNYALKLAEMERDILNENCESQYYCEFRSRYFREDIATILLQNDFSSDIRSTFWYALCANTQYAKIDKIWFDDISSKLNELPSDKMSDKERYGDEIRFLDRLVRDISAAVKMKTEEPAELSDNFRKGIGLLMRCNEAEFLTQNLETICHELGRKQNNPDNDWAVGYLKRASTIYGRAQKLITSPKLKKTAVFPLFEAA